VLLIAAASFGVLLLLFADHQEAQAQTRSTDLIRFMPRMDPLKIGADQAA
jgi:hypothetical protein